LEEFGLPELTSEQIERICEIADETAREFIQSRIYKKGFDLDLTIEVLGTKTIEVKVELRIDLSPLLRNHDVKELTEETTAQVFLAIENYLKGLPCKSKK
jgi:hypothetical protein